MKIEARIRNTPDVNEITLRTNDRTHTIDIPRKADGPGSDVNGGELLFLALATCYCNDIYREAAKRGIAVHEVDVAVEGEFGAEGEGARRIVYRPRVKAAATEGELRALLLHTDGVAEIHNTLRAGVPVILEHS
jgi:organic hydroperoxide reductase OsmC/OhrA